MNHKSPLCTHSTFRPLPSRPLDPVPFKSVNRHHFVVKVVIIGSVVIVVEESVENGYHIFGLSLERPSEKRSHDLAKPGAVNTVLVIG